MICPVFLKNDQWKTTLTKHYSYSLLIALGSEKKYISTKTNTQSQRGKIYAGKRNLSTWYICPDILRNWDLRELVFIQNYIHRIKNRYFFLTVLQMFWKKFPPTSQNSKASTKSNSADKIDTYFLPAHVLPDSLGRIQTTGTEVHIYWWNSHWIHVLTCILIFIRIDAVNLLLSRSYP